MTSYNTLYTVAVFSENRVGLLHQISTIFTRRNLNIETLTVSPSSIDGIHKFSITTYCDSVTIKHVVEQIEKLIDVLKAFSFRDDEIVYQEIALYKVPTQNLINEQNLEKIIRKHNARILDLTREYTILEKTGHHDEIESLFSELQKHNIRQFVRSGRVAITKSPAEYVTMYIEEIEKNRRPADVWSDKE